MSDKEKAAITAQFFGFLSPVPLYSLLALCWLLTRAPPDLQASARDLAEVGRHGDRTGRGGCHAGY